LPGHKVDFVFVPILGEEDEGGTAGDEGGIDFEFDGAFVADLAEGHETLLFGEGGLVKDADAFVREVRFGKIFAVSDGE